ncbi:uncharacterized protein EDB93DRAFT_1108103 [Suillus bovinus]|uniref:uncharacterized protein n=1 Tax=Suillus bovinus TaxID=48563 RepID=UPI001B87B345|nr:uncharacterized protein EDB93DRAFT_1108103 [Suillus bovinus]KAG2131403.1 hypothetical protein EDB93DRAFT_1108103 [Suillus bovinus]
MSDIPPNVPFMKPDYTPFCEHGHGPEGKCKYFRWGSKSPTSSLNPSPSLGSPPQIMLAPPPSGPPSHIALAPPPLGPLSQVVHAPPPVVPGVCAESECTSTRVHPQCGHLMCRKHCWVSGGCDAKGHNIPGPAGEVPRLHPPAEATPTLSVIEPAILAPPPPIIDPALLVPDITFLPSSEAPTAGPSTLPMLSQDTTCKGKGCATNTVTAFAWVADEDAPTVCEFQSGIVLPHVRVTAEWLHNLGLSIDDGCHYFNVTQQCWNKIFVGHVLTLPGNHVYLKNLNVKVALRLRQPPTIPHIRNNLKGERAHVHNTTHHLQHPIEVETTIVLPPWPRWYYVVDINAGFITMENARKSGRSVKEAFASVFGGIPYRPQTVSDHRICWQQAGPTARAAFIEVGRTPAGLWSAFMAA